MSAAEVIAKCIEHDYNRTFHATALCILGDLKAAGYAVVELPEDPHPFSVGLDGDVWDDDLNESYSPFEARVMASRLLAAADTAEVSS